VFWVISIYFNIRNTLPKFCPFLLGHLVYIYIYTYSTYKIYNTRIKLSMNMSCVTEFTAIVIQFFKSSKVVGRDGT